MKPTKPGFYWWRKNKAHKWLPCTVAYCGTGGLMVARANYTSLARIEFIHGEWGDPILPNGYIAKFEDLVAGFAALTDEQRMEVMGDFCSHCGTANPGCQCWNDE